MPTERKFTIRLMVEIEAYGLPEVHESTIIAKVNRELELALGGSVHVTKATLGSSHGNLASWIPDTPMVKEQVQRVGEVEEVPEVRPEETATGSGLRPVQDHMLELRFSFPDQPAEGGTT